MGFRLDFQQGLKAQVRHLLRQELSRVVTSVGRSGDRGDVHQARKVIKRVRSLLRLVTTPANVVETRRLDRCTRGIARSLADARDTDVRLTTFEQLASAIALHPATAARIATALESQSNQVVTPRSTRAPSAQSQLTQAIARAVDLAADLPLSKVSRKAVVAAAGQTYRLGRRRMRQAVETGSAEAFHEWRKETQRHWRQMHLLRDFWPAEMAVRTATGRALAEHLGSDHDLEELANWLKTHTKLPARRRVLNAIVDQQSEHRRHAIRLGQRLFAETGRAFTKRLRSYANAEPIPRNDSAAEIAIPARQSLVQRKRAV